MDLLPSPNRMPWITSIVTMAILVSLASDTHAAGPSDYLGNQAQHRVLRSDLPPGDVGQSRLRGRGPVAGYFQPVAFHGPKGVRFSLPNAYSFADANEKLQAGLMVGHVYRFQITGIPDHEGSELYPTLEIIDRTYPPPNLATRYPIEVFMDENDLKAALHGQLVTRVIYLEDPQTAEPLLQTASTETALDIGAHQDALAVADRFGRPVAILRIGSLAPPTSHELMPSFFLGSPPWAPIFQVDAYGNILENASSFSTPTP